MTLALLLLLVLVSFLIFNSLKAPTFTVTHIKGVKPEPVEVSLYQGLERLHVALGVALHRLHWGYPYPEHDGSWMTWQLSGDPDAGLRDEAADIQRLVQQIEDIEGPQVRVIESPARTISDLGWPKGQLDKWGWLE